MTFEQSLSMLPAPVLAALLYVFIKREFSANDKRWARIESFLDASHKLASKDELTNVGNRFDAKLDKEIDKRTEQIADLRERVKVLESKP